MLLRSIMQRIRGFTFIELVLVITVLGILSVSALPYFLNISTQARQASRDGVVGAVRSGVSLAWANDVITNGPPGSYPAALDAVPNGAFCAPANPCFTAVITNGITDGSWHKTAARRYNFSDGSQTYTYSYNAATGAFTAPNAP